MNIKRVKILSFFLIVISSASAFAYYRHLQIEAASTLTIGTFSQAIDYAPFYIAKHFHWFEPAGSHTSGKVSNIRFKEFSNIGEIQSSLARKQLQVLFAAEAPVIKLVAQGNSLTIAGISCTLQQDILVRNSDKIPSIQNLKGKKVAVLDGTSSHYGLIKILEANKLSPKEISLVTGPPGDIRVAYEAGNIDAWAVWPPFPQQQIIEGRGRLLSGGEAKIQSVLAFSPHISTRQKLLTLKALDKAKEWILKNPDEAIDIVSQTLKIDPEIVRLSWQKHNWSSTLNDSIVKNDIADKMLFLQANGFAPSNPNINIDSLLSSGLR